MPPPRIASPQFSPMGRYLLDVRERYWTDLIGKAVFHDTQNFSDNCGILETPSGFVSRFNGLAWALQRGYVKCSHCFTE